MILLIDNYDSFSYNLVQLIGSISKESIKVVRNDEITIEEIAEINPTHIILSPGPGRPKDAGICEEIIDKLKGKTKILGVCLGHQAICETFGAVITYAPVLMHGKQSLVAVDSECKLFSNLADKILVARYHSLVADKETLPENLAVTAADEHGEIMAVKHKDYDIYGLQFHPESVLTPNGEQIVRNFLNIK